MNINKRLLAYILCVVLVMGTTFSACGKKDNKVEENKPSVTAPADVTATPTAKPTKAPANSIDNYEKGQSVIIFDEEDEFDQYLNELYVTLVSSDEFSLHYRFQDPEKYNIEAQSTFGDINEEFNENFINEIRESLPKFDYDKLRDDQKIYYELLKYEMDSFDSSKDDKAYYIFALSQNNNFISNLQQYYTEFSVQSEKDAELFIKLLGSVKTVIDSEKSFIEDEIVDAKKITREMYDYSITLANAWKSDDIEDNVIYVAFKNNLKEAGLSADKEKEYLSHVEKVINETVIPAIDDYIEYLKGLEKLTVESKGASNFKGGKEYYSHLLEAYLGTGISPEALFKYGEARFDEYMDIIAKAAEEHPLILSTLEMTKSKYSDDPEEIMNALVECSKGVLPDVGTPSWILSYLDKKQEVDTVTAYYLPPQLDNVGRRVIRINGSNISDSINLFVTLAHEGFPGHLYQNEYDFKKKHYQEISSALTYLGYQEGWAMYVEKLAFGWCVNNELKAEILNIDNALNYVLVGLLDIGVNYYGWTISDVKEYFEKKGLGDLAIDQVYSVVVSDPAIYPAYGFGYLLMEDTVNALKDKGLSDIECYKAILDIGAAPYSILWDFLGIAPLEAYK